jgi:hypothetical protein
VRAGTGTKTKEGKEVTTEEEQRVEEKKVGEEEK